MPRRYHTRIHIETAEAVGAEAVYLILPAQKILCNSLADGYAARTAIVEAINDHTHNTAEETGE